jgi:peptide/nickel transport system substrate-binding protein
MEQPTTSHTPERGRLGEVYAAYRSGQIDRRTFLARATALGLGLPVALFILNSVKVDSAVAAPAAQDAPALDSIRPSVGTETQQRGAGGELKILQWQAPTVLSNLVNTGTKDSLAANPITEPLTSYAQDGTLLPTLVTEVPTVENGGLSADLTTVTYKLLPDVLWSDGQPFTADDVVFTFNWIMDTANQSVVIALYQPIKTVEAVDPLTVKVTFNAPTLGWYVPFSGSYNAAIYPKHFWDGKDPVAANDEFRKAPIGTGPYVVESFTENDQVTYLVNDNYREANKPFFARVNIKGGGDAASAAQAVLQTGDWDLAWNLQVEQSILDEMAKAGKGQLYGLPGTNVEQVIFNFSNPDDESTGERSDKDVPHPILSDKAVRQAISLATDRDTITNQFYSGAPIELPSPNLLAGIPAYASPNTSYEFNLDKANQLLDEAGWTKQGDVRAKDGVEIKLKYFTTINGVRQKTQAVNKKNWESLGIQITLGQVDAGVFFDSAAGNDQNANHFFRDIQMFTNGATSTFPLLFMLGWYGGPDGSNIAQKSNGYSGQNSSRYQNPEYDRIFDEVSKTTDVEAAAGMFIQLNDILIADYAEVPLVQRAAEKLAVLNNFNQANLSCSAFEAAYWNIANWNRTA